MNVWKPRTHCSINPALYAYTLLQLLDSLLRSQGDHKHRFNNDKYINIYEFIYKYINTKKIYPSSGEHIMQGKKTKWRNNWSWHIYFLCPSLSCLVWNLFIHYRTPVTSLPLSAALATFKRHGATTITKMINFLMSCLQDAKLNHLPRNPRNLWSCAKELN